MAHGNLDLSRIQCADRDTNHFKNNADITQCCEHVHRSSCMSTTIDAFAATMLKRQKLQHLPFECEYEYFQQRLHVWDEKY